MTRFVEIARDVYVRREPVLDVSVTLVVGDGAALVVDTLSTDDQATELLSEVRQVTPTPLSVVNTHHHFDHTFGNAVLAATGAEIWAHEAAAAVLRAPHGDERRVRECGPYASAYPGLMEGVAKVTVRPPDHIVRLESTVDIGGRPVVLKHLGRGHTAGDIVVFVPDAAVAIAGDLVEESGPPQFADSYPLDWAETLTTLLSLVDSTTTVVPGHGALVDREFVRQQHADLTALAWLIRYGDYDGAPAARVAARTPFDPETSLVAVRRGYDQLAGKG
jgi:glyoxylase-like metal-dependent hydrolase (beta-lactamase superfamily II)